MKKILSAFLAIFVFALFVPTASAYSNFVTDDADLLTEDMEESLESQIMSIRAEYDVDIAIHTTMSTYGESIHSYCENFYFSKGYGEDGLVFVINLNNNEVGNRDFYTYYQGSVYDTFGDDAYNSDDGYVNSEVLPYLADEDYYQAFQTYLDLTESYLSDDDFKGDSRSDESMSPVIKEIIVIVIALIAAFVITGIMKSKMNTAVIKTEASDYVKRGSMNVTRSFDVFTHRHITKTAKPKNNSSGSGGGGRSGGGGGKF